MVGVPESKILIESKSTNTGENCRFTQALLRERGIAAHSFILVQKPYMERRSFATIRQQWPDATVAAVTSPPSTLLTYPTAEISLKTVGHIDRWDIFFWPPKREY